MDNLYSKYQIAGKEPILRKPWLVPGTTRYVHPDFTILGLNVKPCYPTIQAAHDDADGDDEIIVYAGEYTENVSITTAVNIFFHYGAVGNPTDKDVPFIDIDLSGRVVLAGHLDMPYIPTTGYGIKIHDTEVSIQAMRVCPESNAIESSASQNVFIDVEYCGKVNYTGSGVVYQQNRILKSFDFSAGGQLFLNAQELEDNCTLSEGQVTAKINEFAGSLTISKGQALIHAQRYAKQNVRIFELNPATGDAANLIASGRADKYNDFTDTLNGDGYPIKAAGDGTATVRLTNFQLKNINGGIIWTDNKEIRLAHCVFEAAGVFDTIYSPNNNAATVRYIGHTSMNNGVHANLQEAITNNKEQDPAVLL